MTVDMLATNFPPINSKRQEPFSCHKGFHSHGGEAYNVHKHDGAVFVLSGQGSSILGHLQFWRLRN